MWRLNGGASLSVCQDTPDIRFGLSSVSHWFALLLQGFNIWKKLPSHGIARWERRSS